MMGYGNMMGGYGYNMMGAGGFGLIALMLTIIIALAVYRLATHSNSIKSIKNSDSGEALEVLNQRYAKGEIDEEQYRKMRTVLTNK